MEILFKGTPPGEIKYEATCSSCQTRVRFTQSEGKIDSSYQGKFISVECPVCGNVICKDIDKKNKSHNAWSNH